MSINYNLYGKPEDKEHIYVDLSAKIPGAIITRQQLTSTVYEIQEDLLKRGLSFDATFLRETYGFEESENIRRRLMDKEDVYLLNVVFGPQATLELNTKTSSRAKIQVTAKFPAKFRETIESRFYQP